MATYYHLGGYGSGKTSEALREAIYKELISGTRGIVTNVALLNVAKDKGKTISTKPGLGALNALLHKRFKNLDTRVLQRVRMLTEEEVPHFFCHRISRGGYHYDIPVPSPEEEKRGARPDFSLLRDDGIVFVIDEFHDYYNSRLWAEVGRSVGWYKNQQRKLNDDIHACTPQIDEVDKQLRSIGHEYRVYNNLGLRKVRGIVMPRTFICTIYSSLDSIKRKGAPLNKYPFTLDQELADCYDTSKGVRGIQGGSADIGKRPKGIHWAIPVMLFFIVIVGIIYAAFYARRKMFNTVKHASVTSHDAGINPANPHRSLSPSHVAPSHDAGFDPGIDASVPSQTVVAVDTSQSPASEMQQMPLQQVRTNELKCTGWAKIGDAYYATMSDGHVYSSADHELDWIQKRKISILGKTYDIQIGHAYSDYISQSQDNGDFPAASPPAPVNQIDVVRIGAPRQLPSFRQPVTLSSRMGNADATAVTR